MTRKMFLVLWDPFDPSIHEQFATYMLWIAPVVFIVTQFLVKETYGKHSSTSKWMITLNPKLGWIIMESPNLLWAIFGWNNRTTMSSAANYILFGMFVVHYINRSIIYPLRISPHAKGLPIHAFLSALMFCYINGFLQVAHVCYFKRYESSEIWNARFVVGVLIWCCGFGINVHSDGILLNLRKNRSSDTGYQIPRGGMFRYVSCANLLGEMMEWAGYAMAANSYASQVFSIFTCTNLIPRSLATHTWYLKKFDDYPQNRKAVIPFIL